MVEYKSELFNERESARVFSFFAHVICFFFSFFTARERAREKSKKKKRKEKKKKSFLLMMRFYVYASLFYDAVISLQRA